MKKILFALILSILIPIPNLLHSQPSIEWSKCFGGSGADVANSIQQTKDGGFIIAGNTNSNDGDVSENHGNWDYWIVKLNSVGVIQWQKSFGGNGDFAKSIQQTSDGGYIVAGYSSSNDGDVSGNHGDYDYWIIKLNLSGDIQWQKSLGGRHYDQANSIQQTSDSGYIIAGYSYSIDGDVSGNHGYYDYWIVKLNSDGELQWQKSLGGSSEDYANSIQQTSDGGYIIAGSSNSVDGDIYGCHGASDYWIVKLNYFGDIQWEESFGEYDTDGANSIQQTTDGGYIIAGLTFSYSGDVIGNHGEADYWIIKLKSQNVIQWQQPFGGSSRDYAKSIQQTKDGGFIVAGYSGSNDGDVGGNHDSTDYWIVKLNPEGEIEWQKSLGGNGRDYANQIQQTNDGGFIVAGYSGSNDGDVSGNHGNYDYWIVKLSSETGIQENIDGNDLEFTITPNPAQDFIIINNIQFPLENIQIYNLIGNVVKTIELKNIGTQQIDVSDLFPGVYIVRINNKMKMFVKE